MDRPVGGVAGMEVLLPGSHYLARDAPVRGCIWYIKLLATVDCSPVIRVQKAGFLVASQRMASKRRVDGP